MSIDRVRCCAGCPHSKDYFKDKEDQKLYGFLICDRRPEGSICMPQDRCWRTPYELYPKTYVESFCDAYQQDG